MEILDGSRRGVVSNWRLREFVFPDDYPSVADLWKTCGGGVKFNKSDAKDEIKKKINRDPDLFLVAVTSDQIIGTVIGGYDGRRGMAYHLAVSPEFRKHGIGEALMNELEERLISKGCVKAYLMVNPDHPELIEYYKSLGWNQMDILICGKEFIT